MPQSSVLGTASLALLSVTQKTTYRVFLNQIFSRHKMRSTVTITDDRMEVRNDLNRKKHRAETNMME